MHSKPFGPRSRFYVFLLGFLITFLLLQENKATDTISLRTFYFVACQTYYAAILSDSNPSFMVLPHTPLQYIDDKLVLMDALHFLTALSTFLILAPKFGILFAASGCFGVNGGYRQ